MKKILIIVGLLGLIGIVVVFYTYVLKPQTGTEQQIILASLSGDVEIIRNNEPLEDLSIGSPLLPSDIIITRSNSYATIKIRDYHNEQDSTLRIDPLSQSTIGEKLGQVYQFGLDDGHMHGNVSIPVRVTTKGDTYAESEQGSFGISADKTGKMWVGVQQGEVKLSSSGETTTIQSGEQAYAEPGVKPSEPMKIPTSVLLNVKWPEGSELNQRFLVLEGKTSAGSRLLLSNGQTIVPGEDGSFSVPYELSEGLNKLKIEAIDTIGNKKEEETEVTVDTLPPDGQIGKPIFGE